jgi:glyoxylase-like metal-dependent hydrolase (beta-lactamase superfamily II)
MLSIVQFTLGPVQTNTYLIADPETGEAVVIDPAEQGDLIVSEAETHGWRIGNIWLTHAHFDHLAGAASVADRCAPHHLWLYILLITHYDSRWCASFWNAHRSRTRTDH